MGQRVVVYITGKNRGRVSLSLVPQKRPHVRWDDIVADGCTPYQGYVSSQADFGTLVDIGTELPGLLLPGGGVQPAELQIGKAVTVYVRDKRRDTRKLSLTLEPETRARKPWDELVADGCTPYEGTVMAMDPRMGAFIDVGFERCALMPLKEAAYSSGSTMSASEVMSLEPGSRVVVYVTQKQRKTRKLVVTLHKRLIPLISLDDLVADGQTPREGVVVSKADYGAWVDIGCETTGLLPASQLGTQEFESLAEGDVITTYVLTKSRDTGKVGLGLQRSQKPRERWAAIISDGQTPYEGTVTSTTWYGVYADIGCERNAHLTSSLGGPEHDERLRRLKVGDRVTAYVVEKRTETGKLRASIDPSEARLMRVEDLVVDGQTGYYGYVKSKNDLGAWVDIGCDRIGVVWRNYLQGSELAMLEALKEGDPTLVYIIRRNPFNGRLLYALCPSPTRRLSIAEVLSSMGSATYEGVVYHAKHNCAHVDFGCEAAGALEMAGASKGDAMPVRALSFDGERGRFVLERVEEVPPEQAEADLGASLPSPEPQERVPSQPAPSPQPAAPAAGGAQSANHKGQLQNEVMKRLRRSLVAGDVVYTSERNEDGHFVAHVEVVALPDSSGQRFQGLPRQKKVEAEQSAAAAALAHLLAVSPQPGLERPAGTAAGPATGGIGAGRTQES